MTKLHFERWLPKSQKNIPESGFGEDVTGFYAAHSRAIQAAHSNVASMNSNTRPFSSALNALAQPFFSRYNVPILPKPVVDVNDFLSSSYAFLQLPSSYVLLLYCFCVDFSP